jgi:hypothetical protein
MIVMTRHTPGLVAPPRTGSTIRLQLWPMVSRICSLIVLDRPGEPPLAKKSQCRGSACGSAVFLITTAPPVVSRVPFASTLITTCIQVSHASATPNRHDMNSVTLCSACGAFGMIARQVDCTPFRNLFYSQVPTKLKAHLLTVNHCCVKAAV